MNMEEIEATVLAYFSPNVTEQVVGLVNNWQNDPGFLSPALDLLFRSQSDHVRFFATCLIANLIDNHWGEIDHECLNSARPNLLKFLFEAQHSDMIESKLCSLIATLAFNDWPEIWATFFEDVLEKVNEFHFTKHPEDEQWVKNGLSNQERMLEIFEIVATKLVSSSHITLTRRTLLVHEMQYYAPNLLDFLVGQPYPPAAMPTMVKAVLKFFEAFCLNVNDNVELTGKIAEFLFHQFAELSKDTFKCLTKLLVRQKVEKDIFQLVLRLILEEIEKAKVDLVEFLGFVCSFLQVSIPLFPANAVDPGFFGVMKNVLGFILTNCPATEFIDSFWALWSALLHSYVDDLQLQTSAVFLIVDPILPTVVDNLYRLLPPVLKLTKLDSYQAYSSWVALSMIKEDGLIEYLAGQPLSTSLCIVMGCIAFLNDNEKFNALLESKIPEIIQNCEKDVPASMYAIARNAKFVHSHPEIFAATTKLVSALIMTRQEAHQQCALAALDKLIEDSEKLFIANAPDFLMFLITEAYKPDRLQKDEYLHLANILSTLVAAMDPGEVQNNFVQQLVGPAAALLNGGTSEDVQSGCELATSIASIENIHVEVAMSHLWEPLMAALVKTQQSDLFPSVCSCFAMTIRSSTWDLAAPVFDKFMSFVVTVTGQNEAIVDAVTSVKQAHGPAGQYRQIIMQQFMPHLLNDPPSCFFLFFQVFGIQPDEQQTILPLMCVGIRSFDETISRSAISLVESLHISDTAFDVSCEAMFISAITDALFDQMHRKNIRRLLTLLYVIVEKMKKRQLPFEQLLYECFLPRIDSESNTQSFVASLKLATTSKDSFINLMNTFLIAAGRANPNEMALFAETVITANKGTRFKCQGF